MFDNHYHRPESTTVNVNEKRAPTDESVRLLSEMEAAAVAKVIASIRVADTHFEGVVYSQRDYMNDRLLVSVNFSMNGKKLVAKSHFDGHDEGKDIERLIDSVARQIAVEVLKKCMTPEMLKKLR